MVKKTESVVYLCLKLGCGYSMCASREVRNLMNCHQSDVTLSCCAIHHGENVEHNGAFGLSNCSAGRADEGGNNHVKNVKKTRVN